MHYVIIGNSAAGIFAAEAIRSGDRAGRIDIISDEEYPVYSRCLTSYYLTGKMKDEDLFIRNGDFYERNGFNLHAGQKVTKINPETREVFTESGKVFPYDKLLIASGASPAMPDIPGLEISGVFGLRTLRDAKNILAFSGRGKRAVVVGGGLVALKAAYALLQAGNHVTCVISSGQILSRTLDRDSALIVANLLSSKGLNIKYRTDVTEILGKKDAGGRTAVCRVKLSGGEEIPADVVIIGKGVRANTGFLAGTGIKLDEGILADEYLRTNLPNIFAAGDVAQTTDITLGESRINALWPNATEQGYIAGLNMAGQATPYPGSIGMNSADFFGLSTIAAGLTRVEGSGYETVRFFPAPGLYRKLVFRDDMLVGYIMVGDTQQAGILTSLIKEKIPLGKGKDELLKGRIRQRALLNSFH